MALKPIIAGGFYQSGGGGAPGGATTQLQYNNAGAFGGVSGWSTDGANVLTGGAGTSLAIGGATIGANALAVTGAFLLTGAMTIAAGATNFLRILKTYNATNYAIGDASGGIAFSAGSSFFVAGAGVAHAALTLGEGLIVRGTLQIGFTANAADGGFNDTFWTRFAANKF